VEFPPPGDEKYYLLQPLVDPEEAVPAVVPKFTNKFQQKEYWMPVCFALFHMRYASFDFRCCFSKDKLCKVCFACEDAFTMYRRRHHCRVCGQVFCNPCSSFYIDGSIINKSGSVRTCATCFKHLEERVPKDSKVSKKKDDVSKSGRSQSLMAYDHDLEEKVHNDDFLIQHVTAAFLAGKIDSKSEASGSTLPLKRAMNAEESTEEKRAHLNNLQARAVAHMNQIVRYLLDLNDSIKSKDEWESVIIDLIRSVVDNVDPNVRGGDRLDIRPYVKIKTIPGGTIGQSEYVEGVVFRKNVAHKKMGLAKQNPKILILSGGIEFHRQDLKLSSLDTLLDQEDKYLEILVDKIMSLEPDILLVGKSVSRRAQELLYHHCVAVFQHVKPNLLERIARMTGALMLPSTDHMIQQYGSECLGTCGSFKLSQFSDDVLPPIRPDSALRRRITAASIGTNYVVINGCPANLGCTLVLRGASKADLKVMKAITRFCVMVAYHLRLEVAYYADRCIRLPPEPDLTEYNDDSDAEQCFTDYRTLLSSGDKQIIAGVESISPKVRELVSGSMARCRRYLLSQSMDVDFGLPYRNEIQALGILTPAGEPVLDSESFHISPMDHQSLNIASLLMSEGTSQRGRPEVKSIKFYTEQDVTLGQFLAESCFHLQGAFRGASNKNIMLEHTLSFVQRPGRLDIAVCKVGNSAFNDFYDSEYENHSGAVQNADVGNRDRTEYLRRVQIRMTSYCKVCRALVTPDVTMSDETWKMSFGKFLEFSFYNRSARCRTGACSHSIRDDHILFFACDDGYIARFEFHPLHPMTMIVRAKLPIPNKFHISNCMVAFERMAKLKDAITEEYIVNSTVLEKEVREMIGDNQFAFKVFLLDVSYLLKMITSFSASFSKDLNRYLLECSSMLQAIDSGAEVIMSQVSLQLRFPHILKREIYLRSTYWSNYLKRIHEYCEAVRNRGANLHLPSSGSPERGHFDANYFVDQDILDIRNNFMVDSSAPTYDELLRDTDLEMSDSLKSFSELSDAALLLSEETNRNEDRVSSTENTIMTRGEVPLEGSAPVDNESESSSREQEVGRRGVLPRALRRLLRRDNTVPANSSSENMEGRLTLPAGRDGKVVEVHEDEVSTIIAYSLSSVEYQDMVDDFLVQEDIFSLNTEDIDDGPTKKNISRSKSEPIANANGIDPNANTGDLDFEYGHENELTDAHLGLNQYGNTEPFENKLGTAFENGGAAYSNAVLDNQTSEGFGEFDVLKDSDKIDFSQEQQLQAKTDNEVEDSVVPDEISLKKRLLEKRLLNQRKSHVKHRFSDHEQSDKAVVKFVCHSFWAVQFSALRSLYLDDDDDEGFIRSLAASAKWQAQGGKSGASFSKSSDGRFVVKCITRTELQMFLDFAPAYFEYMHKVLFMGLPTVLGKILGVFQTGVHNRTTGKKVGIL
jgi:hypothetical protein